MAIPVLSKTSCACGERGRGVLVLGLCVCTALSGFPVPGCVCALIWEGRPSGWGPLCSSLCVV